MSKTRYKVGQKVRIVGYRVDRMSNQMDKWLGKVMTIARVTFPEASNYVQEIRYRMEEDQEYWVWLNTMIVGEAVSQDELDKLVHKIVGAA